MAGGVIRNDRFLPRRLCGSSFSVTLAASDRLELLAPIVCLHNVDTGGRLRTRIQRWGNSLALRIPKPFAEQTKLRENSPVDVLLRNGRIVVVPAEPAITLSELLSDVTDENLHHPIDTGEAVGKEVW